MLKLQLLLFESDVVSDSDKSLSMSVRDEKWFESDVVSDSDKPGSEV